MPHTKVETDTTKAVAEATFSAVPWYITVMRRGFALAPILLCMYSTLGTIVSITYQISVTDIYPNGLVSSPLVVLTTYDSQGVETSTGTVSCERPLRNPNVEVSCPVTLQNNKIYAAVFFTWLLYFTVLLAYQGWHCSMYAVDDLRYYVNMMKTNTYPFNRTFIQLGMALTAATVVIGLKEATKEPVSNKIEIIGPIALFGVLNVFLLKPFIDKPIFSMTHIDVQRSFPHAIRLQHLMLPADMTLFNLYGAVASCDKALHSVVLCLLLDGVVVRSPGVYHSAQEQRVESGAVSDASVMPHLSQIGDATTLVRAMRILFGCSGVGASGSNHSGASSGGGASGDDGGDATLRTPLETAATPMAAPSSACDELDHLLLPLVEPER